MYCPRCGHQTISDELRFCSYCGFRLAVVKAALAECEEAPSAIPSETQTAAHHPRWRDINLGVILMFAASVFASFLAARMGTDGRTAGAVTLGILYLAIIVLSRPITKGIHKLLSWEETSTNLSTSQRGVCFGSTLMFISTVLLAVSSFLMFGRMQTPAFFAGLALAFPFLLLLSRHFLRALQFLTQGDSKGSVSQSLGTAEPTARLAPLFDVASLPAGQHSAVPIFGPQKVTTAEIVAPSSITEHTTNLLENK